MIQAGDLVLDLTLSWKLGAGRETGNQEKHILLGSQVFFCQQREACRLLFK